MVQSAPVENCPVCNLVTGVASYRPVLILTGIISSGRHPSHSAVNLGLFRTELSHTGTTVVMRLGDQQRSNIISQSSAQIFTYKSIFFINQKKTYNDESSNANSCSFLLMMRGTSLQ